jgi:para-aminobenzoate synthetase component I
MMSVQIPLVAELHPAPDPAVAVAAFAQSPAVLFLDSALKREPTGRYSFLCADPFHFEELQEARYGVDPFAELRRRLDAFVSEPIPELPPFQGGAAGLLSYELSHCWERIAPAGCNEFELPALAVGVYDWVIAWDHVQNRTWIISQGFPEIDPDRRLRRARERLDWVKSLLNSPISNLKSQISEQASPLDNQASPSRFGNRLKGVPPAAGSVRCPIRAPQTGIDHPALLLLTSNFSREAYLRAVEAAIEYICAGDIFQVNLSQRLLHPQTVSPLDLYRRLRERNPAPMAGFFAHDDWAVASASPERFVSVCNREVETRPIKGTRRRRTQPEADLFTRDELRESEKDQAENVMIVDLLRNDLSRVCEPGSVRVPGLCRVETYETVQHLVSEVRGRLRADQTTWDLLRATFPGGSITGAPKVRAMQIIAELEPTVRGPYCGCLFYAGFDGNMDSSILIRTFTMRRGWIQFPVGGGIVAQSDPAAEYEETLDKAAGMLRALV